MDDDVVEQLPEIVEVRRTPASVLRLTPLEAGGVPDHGRARVWEFEEPVWLLVSTVRGASEVRTYSGRVWPVSVVDRVHGAITVHRSAAAGPDALVDLAFLAARCRQHGMGVEAWWSGAAGGRDAGAGWDYTVVPRWRWLQDGSVPDAELGVPARHRVVTCGSVHRPGVWSWPPSGMPAFGSGFRVLSWVTSARTHRPPPSGDQGAPLVP